MGIRILITFPLMVVVHISNSTKLGRSLMGVMECFEAQKSCAAKLDEQVDWNDKFLDNLNSESPSVFECCYYAEFLHCFENIDDCNNSLNSFLGNFLGL